MDFLSDEEFDRVERALKSAGHDNQFIARVLNQLDHAAAAQTVLKQIRDTAGDIRTVASRTQRIIGQP